ncbi:MAG: hypothetical protein R3E39_16230 [Anaerolineae bacterium]
MATQSISSNTQMARLASQADGLLCAISGAVFALGAGAVSTFAGIESSAFLLILGVGLLVYGLGILYIANKTAIDRRLPLALLLGNIAWIVASLLFLAADPFNMTTEGRWLTLILADVVGVMAIWQFVALRRMRR